jgi:hypothetical protein
VGKEDLERERPPASPDHAASVSERPREDRAVLCARCGHTLAKARDAIEVSGAHVHEFANPSGVAYRIGCFADAAGCAHAGERETFFSWFPGHAWQVALCAACGAHVGWAFMSISAGFYGLILANVAS